MYSYINENGKRVSGTGATVHEIYTVHGGLQEYHDYVGEQYLKHFIKTSSNQINSNIQTQSRKNKIKAI